MSSDPTPSNAGDRTKAHRLRRRKDLGPVDKLWLAQYDDAVEDKKKKRKHKFDVGASRSQRRVRVEVDEEQEAAGTGEAAKFAAAALEAKEEGRRLDALTVNALDVLKEAVATYRDVCLSMKDRLEILEATHIAMLDSVRESHIDKTNAEIELMKLASAEGGPGSVADQMFMQLVASRLGISLPNGTPRPAPPRRGPPPKVPPA